MVGVAQSKILISHISELWPSKAYVGGLHIPSGLCFYCMYVRGAGVCVMLRYASK